MESIAVKGVLANQLGLVFVLCALFVVQSWRESRFAWPDTKRCFVPRRVMTKTKERDEKSIPVRIVVRHFLVEEEGYISIVRMGVTMRHNNIERNQMDWRWLGTGFLKTWD